MNYGTAENEIVTRLNTYFTTNDVDNLYEAALMPETEAEFKTFYANFTKARAAVQFIDTSPQPSQSISSTVQEEIVRFRLCFEARKLRGAGGLYNMMELVKLSLIGYKLTNCDRLSLVKYGLLEFEQGAWQPYYEFECKTMNVQTFNDFADDEPYGNFPPQVQTQPEQFTNEFSENTFE